MQHNHARRDRLPGQASTPAVPAALRLLIPAAIFLVTLLVFWPSVSCGFVDLDDAKLITENPDFRGLSLSHVRWMFGSTVMGHWQPLTWVSYGIDYTLAGLDPSQFHRTSILLHSANAALLYLVIARLVRLALPSLGAPSTSSRIAAAAGALLWSLHPLRVESATWVTERRDVLSGFFLLLTVLAYLRAFPPGQIKPASRTWYALSVLLLALSLLSKAWGMSFFAVAAILDWYPLRRLPPNPLHWFRRPALLVQKLPYLLLGLASARMASWAINSVGAMRTLSDWPLESRIPQVFYGLVFYVWKTLWPTNLCALYELRHGLNPFEAQYIACYAIVLVAVGAVLILHRRLPALTAAAASYAICVGPVLGLFQSGDQFVADRYSYVACMSWSVFIAGGLLALLNRFGDRLRIPLFSAPFLVAGILAAVTVPQVIVWTDAVSLWRHAWESDPSRMMAHINYALNIEVRARQLEQQGQAAQSQALLNEAINHFRIATQLQPHDGRGWFPLGNALKRQHDLAGAEAAFREAAKYLPQAYLPLVNLGYLLEQDPARRDEALAAFRAAVESVEHPRPGSYQSAKPFLALGLALKNRGQTDEARAVFTRAIELATQYKDPETIQQARGHLATLPPPK